MSTMLHRHADDSSATFDSARASSFHSAASTTDEFWGKGSYDDDWNSSFLFSSGSVDRCTCRCEDHAATCGEDDRVNRIGGIKAGGRDLSKMQRSAEQFRSLWLQRYLRRQTLRQLRQDDNGNTYLAELKQKNRTPTLYTIKIMSKQQSNKFWAVETERNVLRCLNHPFLPSVYADVDSPEFAFLVMDFCQGGDLRALLRRNPLREEVARVYAAEVLLAMEYLHENGIIYRGLKPENVHLKADGHIMLSGFDHAMWRSPAPPMTTARSTDWSLCFGGLVQHVVQSIIAPPEVVKDKQHDVAADWYTYGIFLYELLFGTTPFETHDDRMKCIKVVAPTKRGLKFPREPIVSPAARDLLRRLLDTNPKRRLGHEGGAAEVKQHAFFRGTNFALLREMAAGRRKPPELPKKY